MENLSPDGDAAAAAGADGLIQNHILPFCHAHVRLSKGPQISIVFHIDRSAEFRLQTIPEREIPPSHHGNIQNQACPVIQRTGRGYAHARDILFLHSCRLQHLIGQLHSVLEYRVLSFIGSGAFYDKICDRLSLIIEYHCCRLCSANIDNQKVSHMP